MKSAASNESTQRTHVRAPHLFGFYSMCRGLIFADGRAPNDMRPICMRGDKDEYTYIIYASHGAFLDALTFRDQEWKESNFEQKKTIYCKVRLNLYRQKNV